MPKTTEATDAAAPVADTTSGVICEAASSSTSAPKDAVIQSQDITQSFFTPGEDLVKCTQTSLGQQKERFLIAKLVVPGISLKKFHLSIHPSQQRDDVTPKSTTHVAVLGASVIKQYKISKPTLAGMVIGDALTSPQSFWNTCTKHLTKTKISAIFLSDNFAGTLDDVPCPFFILGMGQTINIPKQLTEQLPYCSVIFVLLKVLFVVSISTVTTRVQ